MGPAKRLSVIVAASAALLAGVTAATVAPAFANASQGYVAGAGTITDDLNDESTLSSGGSYWHGNYAAMWQFILYIDVQDFYRIDVDCEIGSYTASKAVEWQHARHLPETGQFDADSRTYVENHLVYVGPSSDGDYYHYSGPYGDLQIHRHSGSYVNPYAYDIRSIFDSTEWHAAWYNTHNFSFCK